MIFACLCVASCGYAEDGMAGDEEIGKTQEKAFSLADIQGEWLWTGSWKASDPDCLYGTWEGSSCSVTKDSIIFYVLINDWNPATGEVKKVRSAEERYQYTFVEPNSLHFNGADYLVMPHNDGWMLKSAKDGYVLKKSMEMPVMGEYKEGMELK